jgi:hypothetical protein
VYVNQCLYVYSKVGFITLSDAAFLVVTSWVVIKRERCDTCARHWVAGGDLLVISSCLTALRVGCKSYVMEPGNQWQVH